MPRAIEEMLRYDGPVQTTFRIVTERMNLGGTLVASENLIRAGAETQEVARAIRGGADQFGRVASRGDLGDESGTTAD